MNFNLAAVGWDDQKRINRAKIIANEIIKSINIKEHSCAMEFGCGTGLVSFNLSDKFDHITLIDTSEGMIEKLKQKILDSGLKNMTAVQTDINSCSELQDKFDVIYTSMALHHIIDTKATLKKLYGLLKDEGYICIVELDAEDGSFHKQEKDFNGHNGFDQQQLKKLLEELGLKNIVTDTFYKDKKVEDDLTIEYSLFLMTGEK